MSLTPEQIANWKMAFPEMALFTDDMINGLRDKVQGFYGQSEAVASEPTGPNTEELIRMVQDEMRGHLDAGFSERTSLSINYQLVDQLVTALIMSKAQHAVVEEGRNVSYYTCTHHTDAQREGTSLSCPVCIKHRDDTLTGLLRDAKVGLAALKSFIECREPMLGTDHEQFNDLMGRIKNITE